MALLSCWGEVTTENEKDVIAANCILHPKLEELLSILTDILNSAKIEYWIDQAKNGGNSKQTATAIKYCEVFEPLMEEFQVYSFKIKN